MAGKGRKAKVAEAKAAVPAGAEAGREGWLPVAGFGLVVLPVAASVIGLLSMQPPAPLVAVPEVVAAPEESPLPLHYVDLPDPLTVAVAPDKPRAEMSLALVVRGELEDLVPLKDRVMVKADVVYAAMLQQAQDLVVEGAEGAALHSELPLRLRDAINRTIGTPDWPEPVVEVLITSLVMQR